MRRSLAQPAHRFTEVPEAIVDKRARDLYRACAEAKSFQAEKLGDGGIALRIEDSSGGRRRSFVDEASWTLIAKHLRT